MPAAPTTSREDDDAETGGRAGADGDAASWPWDCLDCGTTIYHDGECCMDCEAARRRRVGAREAEVDDGFLAWMRRESLAAFSLKVTATAGVELALTALWLRLLLRGTVGLAGVVPLVG